MPVIQSKSDWSIETQELNMKKGKLVRVQIGPGQFIKVYEADLRNKAQVPTQNKILKSETQNKGAADPGPEDQPAADPGDDLSSIPGIGKASARVLNEHGIWSFVDLFKAGELDYLSQKINEKIQAWREEQLAE